jgi:hypothetical protein
LDFGSLFYWWYCGFGLVNQWLLGISFCLQRFFNSGDLVGRFFHMLCCRFELLAKWSFRPRLSVKGFIDSTRVIRVLFNIDIVFGAGVADEVMIQLANLCGINWSLLQDECLQVRVCR